MSELSGFTYRLPEIKRALVLSPHPDDETLGCGGTIAMYADKIDFTIIALSNGEAVNIPEENKSDLRKKELVEALKVLGVEDVILLGLPDGQFEESRVQISKRLTEICSQKQPDLIFAPSPFDPHPDHRETAKACIALSEAFPLMKIAFYEVYDTIRFNTLIDISGKLETKREALSRYHYSMLKKEGVFISAILSLNKFRSLFTLEDSYYEAFFITDGPVTVGETLRRLSFSSQPHSPEEELLASLRIGDSLLSGLRDCERTVSSLREKSKAMREEIDKKSLQVSSLEQKTAAIERSLFWKIAKYFYK